MQAGILGGRLAMRVTGVLLSFVASVFAALVNGSDRTPERFMPVGPNEQIPVRDFCRPFQFLTPELNPSGTRLAAVVTTATDHREIAVVNLLTGTTNYVEGDTFHWLSDDLLVLFSPGLHIVDVGFLKGKLVENIASQRIAGITSVLGYYKLHNPDEKPGVYAYWASLMDSDGNSVEADLLNGYIFQDYSQPPEGVVVGYGINKDGGVRFAYTSSHGLLTLYRLGTNPNWIKCPVDLDSVDIIGPGDQAEEVIVLGPRQPGQPRAIQRMDTVTGKLGEVLYQDRRYDYSGGSLYRAPVSHQVIGIHVYRRGPQTIWISAKYRALQAQLDKMFSGKSADITCSDDAEKKFVVWTYSDRDPGSYYLLDTEKHSLGLLKKASPWIDPNRMRPMQPITYRARDESPIEAYLTLPSGASKETPVPLVVLAHDGPWLRNVWAYDSWVQFLASRGYAVLQPNYRGSAGYEWRFPDADKWDFRKMHDDVTDGARQIIRSGLVDSRRIAIMGVGFGGYLAISGAAFEPELYRCAITIDGIFDWEQLMGETKFFIFGENPEFEYLRRHLGDPEADKAKFDAISPLRHVGQIKAPVFVSMGYDSSFPLVKESRRLVDALEDQHVPHQVRVAKKEGKKFLAVDNSTELLTAIESFLSANMAQGSSAQHPSPTPVATAAN